MPVKRDFRRRWLQALGVLLLLVFSGNEVSALIVFDYSETGSERFLPGTFPSAPATNSNSLLGSYDLSGVGWQTGATNLAVTLVSPKNFLVAGHVAPSAGSTVAFLGNDGVVRTYTVASTTAIEFSPGIASDLVVGTLTETVAAPITHYASLYLGNQFSAYTGLNLAVYGANGRLGLNSIAGFVAADFNPNDGTTDNIFARLHYDGTNGGTPGHPAGTMGQSGDSSSPSFALIDGHLAVVGLHSAIDATPPADDTYDTFVPMYLNQINAVLQASGYGMSYYTAIPEPAAVGLCLGTFAGATVLAHRRRRVVKARDRS